MNMWKDGQEVGLLICMYFIVYINLQFQYFIQLIGLIAGFKTFRKKKKKLMGAQ